MTIKRLRVGESVATCIKQIPEPYKFYGIEYPGDIAICALENLEHEEKK